MKAPTNLRSQDALTGKPEWQQEGERGSSWLIRWTFWFVTAFGRPPARFIVAFVAFYYTLFSPKARQASALFLSRVGRTPGFWAAYRQIRRFSQCTIDAAFLLQGKLGAFRFTRDGHAHLEQLAKSKTGAILLGAHLGSFYALRAAGSDESLPIYPLVYTKNARRFNDVLESVAPESKVRLIEIDDSRIDFMLKVKELIEEGALVAVLADRIPKSGSTIEVDFLGDRANLPMGPYQLANAMKCPVYFTVGLFRAPNHYELHCEPFAERVVLERGRRKESAKAYAQKYADRVAHYARSAPDNWFNFYDFWKPKD